MMTAALATSPSALAQLLLKRFAGRRSVYAKRVRLRDEDRWGYVPARRDPKVRDGSADLPLTVEVIERHLTSPADAIGVYLVPDGERRVSFAALDIDNHGPAPLPWSEFAERVRPLIASLKRFGQPLAVRSGGGHGIHLVLFFDKPQEAAKVRGFLRHVVVGCRLKVAEGANSAAGGMQAGVVEMFPKQDNVKVGDYGNLIALPFGRKSVPLSDDLEPLSRDAAFERLEAVPTFDLPETREDRTRSTAETPADAPVDGAGAANVVPFRRPGLDPASEAGVAEGGRDETAWKLACKWRGENLPIEEAGLKMDVFCDGCEPPLDRKLGREKLHRAYEQFEPNVEINDSGNADYFTRLYSDRVRYDHMRKRWLIWDQHWWREDKDQEVVRLAAKAMKSLGKSAFDIKDTDQAKRVANHALKSRNLKPLENLLKLALKNKPISNTGENWDRDPWLFGVANGVLDLKTGERRDGRQEDCITMRSPVAFDPSATCPEWERYVDEMYSGNKELIDFIQRMLGYTLTGNVREEVLTFHLGSGSNGKSLLLEILIELFGDYGHTLNFRELENWAKTNVPTEIAEMVGKRLVVTSEADERAELNCARLKSLGSRDQQRARFLFARSFQFKPTQHYWLALNHPPKVNDDTDGFWRRVALVPYRQKFSPAPLNPADREPGVKYADKELGARIIANELPGILAWAVRGCLEWQRRPLTPFPASIAEASAEYRADEDMLAPWIEAECRVGEGLRGKPEELFRNYRKWAQTEEVAAGDILNVREFKTKLSGKFPRIKVKGTNLHRGIDVRAYREYEEADDLTDGDPRFLERNGAF